MRTKNVKIAQMIIAIIFVVAIAYFIAGIVMDKKTGPLKAQRRFDTFMMETSTLAATHYKTVILQETKNKSQSYDNP